MKEGGRFLGKRYASNETLPVYGEREEERGNVGLRRFRKRIERERGRGSSGGGGEEEGGGRGEGVL